MAGSDGIRLGELGPVLPWTPSDWPPPARLWVRTENPGYSIVDEDPSDPKWQELLGDGWVEWERISASDRPEPWPEGSHVFRGALYEMPS